MPTDLEQQLARFAEALDREAPTISFDDTVGRGAIAVDVDLLEHPSSDRASGVNGVSWIDTTPSHDEIGERDVVIELAPAVAARRPARRSVALKAALAVAAVAVLVVSLAAMERGDDQTISPAGPDETVVDFPDLTSTFVSPRNGFSIRHPEGATVVPAEQFWGWGEQLDDGFDVMDTGSGTVFRGTSTEFPSHSPCPDAEDEPIPCGSIDGQVDQHLSDDLPGRCGVPRSRQAQITIDGQSGRVVECADQVEATVIAGGRLYVFTLSHDGSDGREIFEALIATIYLTPETALEYPGMTTTFVSPTYGYSFAYHDRGGLEAATQHWDPDGQPVDNIDFDRRFDGVETGLGAYFEAASTEIPEGVSIDEWIGTYVTPRSAGGCGVPRSEQQEISIDGRPGRKAECDHSEATVVAGGRLYLFIGPHDDRGWFDAWLATIDLTPETAAVP